MNEVPQAALDLAYEMLAAGADELALYDPEKENPLVVVARIYTAMELVRILIEEASMIAAMSRQSGASGAPALLN